MTGTTPPHELIERALELSAADGCMVIATERSAVNLRWAGNALTTNGAVHGRRLTVISTLDGATGTSCGAVTRAAVTAADLDDLVRASEQAARESGTAEDAQPLIGTGAWPGQDAASFAEPPGETSVDALDPLAAGLREVLARSRGTGRLCYGFVQHEVTSSYLGTSTGLRLRHDQPTATAELTLKPIRGEGSAWDGAAGRAPSDLDLVGLLERTDPRLAWAARTVDLPPGRYPTLLPPSATADLMIYLYWESGGRDAAEGRTVFARPGGTRIGERLTRLPVTLRSDPGEPGLEATPFVLTRQSGEAGSVFDNGMPLAATRWISDGVLTDLVTTRHSAGLTGLPIRPAIDNLVLEPAEPTAAPTLDQLVRRIDRGLLLTCLWYLRSVDPASLLLTGLTRDGVYLVEGGEVVGAVNNFRFNESPVDLLSRAEAIGRSSPCLARDFADYFPRTAMPPILVPDFNMSSVSRAS
jgi:predicted Zn-dependent protease